MAGTCVFSYALRVPTSEILLGAGRSKKVRVVCRGGEAVPSNRYLTYSMVLLHFVEKAGKIIFYDLWS